MSPGFPALASVGGVEGRFDDIVSNSARSCRMGRYCRDQECGGSLVAAVTRDDDSA